jgi:hypothetical protein
MNRDMGAALVSGNRVTKSNLSRSVSGLLVLALGVTLSASATASGVKFKETRLSAEELRLVDERLKLFYGSSEAAPMHAPLAKFDALTGARRPERTLLSLPAASQPANPLLRLAQAKATPSYQKWHCETFLKRHFKDISCADEPSSWASVQDNDTLEGLTETWIDRADLVYDLDRIPAVGKTGIALWSDDYWRTQWGGIAYRYREKKAFSSYREAIADYAQPVEWILAGSLPQFEWASDQISSWSPAEKYDLTVGDEAFTMTKQQKKDGEGSLSANGNVEPWIGICHGWAPAAMMVPRPMKDVVVTGKDGMKIRWTAHDVRSIATLAWANGTFSSNYAGARCRPRSPQTYSNGRIVDQNCFDSNPATFHLALGNMVGKSKLSFVFDNTYDYEIWNQPVHSYEFIYFNPERPEERSANWRDVATKYDRSFKAQDRFQSPNTRGIRAVPADDGKIKKVVGVVATVVYAAEVFPRGTELLDQALGRVTFLYDLELEERNGTFVPTGGEWHQSAHPDFLWVPRKGQSAASQHDNRQYSFSETAPADAAVLAAAQPASAQGYPLCQVLKTLLKGSTESSQYECPPLIPTP